MKNEFEKLYMEERKSILMAAKKYSRELHIDLHEIESLLNFEFWKAYNDYDESLGKVTFKTFYSRRLKQRALDAYRKRERKFYESAERIDRLRYENEDDENAATFEVVDEFNLEEHVTKKKRADQRKLIDSLLNGADETTTAIVEAFLAHPNPNATAIAKELGCHHSKVIRALNRLAGKFSTKQFGDYHDYLVAL